MTACACERSGDVTLPQLLHLQNGDWIAAKLHSNEGRLAGLLAAMPDDAALVETLFLTCLTRPPRPEELPVVERMLAQSDDFAHDQHRGTRRQLFVQSIGKLRERAGDGFL